MSAASAHRNAWSIQASLAPSANLCTLTIAGRIGSAGAAEVRRTCTDAFERGGRVRLDLEQVDYISSAGIALLFEAAQRVHDHGGTLELGRCSEAVRLALRIAGPIPHLGASPPDDEGSA